MRSVRSSFDPWNRDGTCIKINDTLRHLARHALDRNPEPSISVLDSQSTITTEAGEERGFDGGKRSTGANGNAGLIRTGSSCVCSSARRIFQIRKGRNGFWSHIIDHFLGCTRFVWTRGINKMEAALADREIGYS